MTDEHIYKSHTKTLSPQHLVFPLTCPHRVDKEVGERWKVDSDSILRTQAGRIPYVQPYKVKPGLLA